MFSEEIFIEKVTQSLNNNELALFVAAGISASAGYPSWFRLLEPCAKELGLKLETDTNLYMVAQYYVNTYGKNELIHIFEREINRINRNSNYLNAVLDLNFREIWTTNYDTAVEDNLKRRNIIPKVIHNDADLNKFTDGGVHLYKMNGDITNPEKMIISKDDLDHYHSTHELMLTFLRRELASKSFLFLGYSFTDTLILDALSSIKSCLGDSSNIHYTIMKNEHSLYFDYFIDDLWKRYNIRTLLVEDYSQISNILKKIKHKSKERKIFISGSFDILTYEEDNFADELCKNLVNYLYDNNFVICTGMGRKVGNYLSGHAFEYLANNDVHDIEKKLMMRPFFERMNATKKSHHREKMIEECSSVIFIFGKSQTLDGSVKISEGVIEEYNIAMGKGKNIIPIPTTNYAAKHIFKLAAQNILKFPYLEPYQNLLQSEENPEKIARLVVTILNDCI